MNPPNFTSCNVGSIASSKGRTYRPEPQNNYLLQIGYISRGAAVIEAAQKKTSVRAGELFFIPFSEAASHTIRYSNHEPTWQFWFEFHNDTPSAEDCTAVNRLPRKMVADPKALRLIESVYIETSLYNSPEKIKPDFLNMISASLLEHLCGTLETTTLRKDRSYELIEKAMNFIQKYYDLDIDSTRIAEHCGVSRDHLIHTFRKCSHATPIQCLWSFRLKQAALLLEATNRSISEIAYLTGFKDIYHFTRRFKQQYDRPPGQYRKCRAAQRT